MTRFVNQDAAQKRGCFNLEWQSSIAGKGSNYAVFCVLQINSKYIDVIPGNLLDFVIGVGLFEGAKKLFLFHCTFHIIYKSLLSLILIIDTLSTSPPEPRGRVMDFTKSDEFSEKFQTAFDPTSFSENHACKFSLKNSVKIPVLRSKICNTSF